MIVWNGLDLICLAVMLGALALLVVIELIHRFCEKLEDWGKKRQEKPEIRHLCNPKDYCSKGEHREEEQNEGQ